MAIINAKKSFFFENENSEPLNNFIDVHNNNQTQSINNDSDFVDTVDDTAQEVQTAEIFDFVYDDFLALPIDPIIDQEVISLGKDYTNWTWIDEGGVITCGASPSDETYPIIDQEVISLGKDYTNWTWIDEGGVITCGASPSNETYPVINEDTTAYNDATGQRIAFDMSWQLLDNVTYQEEYYNDGFWCGLAWDDNVILDEMAWDSANWEYANWENVPLDETTRALIDTKDYYFYDDTWELGTTGNDFVAGVISEDTLFDIQIEAV